MLRHPEAPPVLQGNVGFVGVPGPELLEEASLEVGQHPIHVHQHPQSPAGPRCGAGAPAQPCERAAAPRPQVQEAAQQNHGRGEGSGQGMGGVGVFGWWWGGGGFYFKHAPCKQAALASTSPRSRRKERRGCKGDATGSRGAAEGLRWGCKGRSSPPAPPLPPRPIPPLQRERSRRQRWGGGGRGGGGKPGPPGATAVRSPRPGSAKPSSSSRCLTEPGSAAPP